MEESQSPIAGEENPTGSPRLRRTLLFSGALLLAFLFGMGASYLVWARPLEARLVQAQAEAETAAQSAADAQAAADAQSAGATQAAAAQTTPQQVRRYDVPLDDDPVLGASDAPITIIEFSDYECPFCKRWHLEVWPVIQDKYGDKVRLVYRDFPLYSIHPNAGPAALAANCAGEQERYWEFNEMLFATDLGLGRTVYETFAKQLDIDLDDFAQCLDEERHAAEVDADYQYASYLGVRSTPTFFINGLAVVGAQPFEVFEQIIDMELAGEIPQ